MRLFSTHALKHTIFECGLHRQYPTLLAALRQNYQKSQRLRRVHLATICITMTSWPIQMKTHRGR